jgi:hypothetical protein
MQEILWQPFLPSDAILRIARLLRLSLQNHISTDFMDGDYLVSVRKLEKMAYLPSPAGTTP